MNTVGVHLRRGVEAKWANEDGIALEDGLRIGTRVEGLE